MKITRSSKMTYAEMADLVTSYINKGVNTKLRLRDILKVRAKISSAGAVAFIDGYTGNDPKKHCWNYKIGAHNRKEFYVLQEKNVSSIEETLVERKSTYGSFEDNSDISQTLKARLRAFPKWQLLNDVQKEALEMVCLKLSRILSPGEGHAHIDNWHDIAGYAKLVENQLKNGRCNDS